MPCEAGESDSVWSVRVVESGVFGFLSAEGAVKGLCFKADFGNKVLCEEALKVSWIVGFRSREHRLVDELVYWSALHLEDV